MLKKIALPCVLMVSCAYVPLTMAEDLSPRFESYVGVSGGVNFLKGYRKLSSQTPFTKRTIPGAKHLSSKAPVLNFHVGFRYSLPGNKIFIGLDPYISLSKIHAKSMGYTVGIAEFTSLKSRYSYGVDIKPGVKLTDQDSLYMIAGVEVRKVDFSYGNGLSSSRIKTRKTMIAPTIGAGYDHSFGKVSVGFDVKHSMYGKTTLKVQSSHDDTIKGRVCPSVTTAMISVKYKI